MLNFGSVSWFRFWIVVVMSLATSLSIFYADEFLSRGEIAAGIIQAIIAGFSYLQCPDEGSMMMRRQQNNERTNSAE